VARVHVVTTITNSADLSDTWPLGHFLAWMSCSKPQHTQWPITLPQPGGHKEEHTHNEQCMHKHQCRLGGSDAQQADTNVSKLLDCWTSNTYIQCLLPQLLCYMPLLVMFPLPTTSCWLCTICTAILAKYMYACAYPT